MNAKRLLPPGLDNPGEYAPLRSEVRAFLQDSLESGLFTPGVDTWLAGWDPDFSRRLAACGWIGMTIPTQYGGHGRSHTERFIVTEELLAYGAPVAAHWIADRQIAPSLLKFGTEEQKLKFLPEIVQGTCFFGIGMSEPDSGSDLASVRTKAVQVDGGWKITGTKIWTSGAHHADAFFALARTSPKDPANRHAGLSQFIVDLRSTGVEIRPVISMTGSHHFNEVILDDVFVPDDMVLGRIGDGWRQVTSELGYERSGPERFLSTFALLAETVEQARLPGTAGFDDGIGRFIARITGLHHMSLAVAGALQRGDRADSAAAAVKLLGTTTEGDIAEYVDLRLDREGTSQPDDLRKLVESAVQQRPGFTLRGGTTEVLEGIVARELGLR